MTLKLNEKNLAEISASVKKPNYDRSALSAGIVHIGVGNFHRAHQSWYLHRLMQMGLAHDWTIVGAGVQPYDAQQREKLKDQDYLTTLIELAPEGKQAEIVGSMIDFIEVEPGNATLIARMSQPDIRIVSMTVTEGGYFLSAATNQFDVCHPDITADLADMTRPNTAFGAIVAALKQRRANGAGPITLMSCDNLLGNGEILQQVVVGLARKVDLELAAWIETSCTFPNSMVDSIVPATGAYEIGLARDFGIEDAAPVTHEDFRAWVIEDKFCAGRPPWETVGALLTDNVEGYEKQKIRILNAGHQIIANAGELLNLPLVSDLMSNPRLAAFLDKVVKSEILPFVEEVPEMSALAFYELSAKRFRNPTIGDTTRRIAFDGSSRHPGFVLPSVREALAANAPIGGLALVEALWARMCAGEREDGSTIKANDPHWERLQVVAKKAKTNPSAWLDMVDIYGDLAQQEEFQSQFCAWLSLIWARGVEASIDDYLRG